MGESVCPMELGMNLLGKKWLIVVLFHLFDGPMRFSELEEATSISGRLLSERLRDLEDHDMVTRTVYPEIPPKVVYTLTEKGRLLQPAVLELFKWSKEWMTKQQTLTDSAPNSQENPECL